MRNNYRLIVLWILLVIGMVLHFNYHISGLIYGINVVKDNADGSIPVGLIFIRNIFYHLPMLWVVLLLYCFKKWTYVMFFVISILYLLANLAHVSGEIFSGKNDISQITLLSTVFIVSIVLSIEHFKAIKKATGKQRF